MIQKTMAWFAIHVRAVLAPALMILGWEPDGTRILTEEWSLLAGFRDAGVFGDMISTAPSPTSHAPGAEPLTPAEWRILRPLATGLSQVEIAAELCVSPNTVKTHRRSSIASSGSPPAPPLSASPEANT